MAYSRASGTARPVTPPDVRQFAKTQEQLRRYVEPNKTLAALGLVLAGVSLPGRFICWPCGRKQARIIRRIPRTADFARGRSPKGLALPGMRRAQPGPFARSAATGTPPPRPGDSPASKLPESIFETIEETPHAAGAWSSPLPRPGGHVGRIEREVEKNANAGVKKTRKSLRTRKRPRRIPRRRRTRQHCPACHAPDEEACPPESVPLLAVPVTSEAAEDEDAGDDAKSRTANT